MGRGGLPSAEVWRLTAEQIRDRLIQAGLLSAQELQQVLAPLKDPPFVWMEGLVMAVRGSRPGTQVA